MLNIFKTDYHKYEGVPPINIYLLRLMFLLMIIFLGKDSWTHIFTFKGSWNLTNAMAWSIWASYSILAILGLIQPLKMLPIVMLEIMYKVIWLGMVACPLWRTSQLTGSPAEQMTYAFLWVLLPIIAMPWRYFFRHFILFIRANPA
jgi:hypothetical protein